MPRGRLSSYILLFYSFMYPIIRIMVIHPVTSLLLLVPYVWDSYIYNTFPVIPMDLQKYHDIMQNALVLFFYIIVCIIVYGYQVSRFMVQLPKQKRIRNYMAIFSLSIFAILSSSLFSNKVGDWPFFVLCMVIFQAALGGVLVSLFRTRNEVISQASESNL